MKNKIELIPFVVALLSILVIGGYLRYNLNQDAIKFAKEFQAQNSTEIYSADLFKISSKLNRLNYLGNWTCLKGFVGNKEFFSIKNGSCGTSILKQKVQIHVVESDMLLEMTLELSTDEIIVFILLMFFQLCIVVSLGLVFKAIENLKQEDIKIFNKKALKLSHDIRSPLAALKAILKNDELGISQNTKLLMENSVELINQTAEELLRSNLRENYVENVHVKTVLIEVVKLKQLEFPNVKISMNGEAGSALCVQNDLKRIISNMLNNSIEANCNGNPKIQIALSSEESHLVLVFKDNGSGISAPLLKLIGKKAITTKKEGNGIGLISAIETIRSWGGEFEIVESSESEGTIIKVKLKKVLKDLNIVLIDDDQLTRMVWESKAAKENVNLICFSSRAECLEKLNTIKKETVFYIDHHIGSDSGVELARELFDRGYKELYMATGSSKDEFKGLSFIKGIIGKEPPF